MYELVKSYTGLSGFWLDLAVLSISIFVLYSVILCFWSIFKKVGGL